MSMSDLQKVDNEPVEGEFDSESYDTIQMRDCGTKGWYVVIEPKPIMIRCGNYEAARRVFERLTLYRGPQD